MKDTMKAVMLVGEKQVKVVEVPTPKPDGLNVIIKVEACGICGSDIHFWELGDSPVYKNMIPGHEFAGTVVDPGAHPDLKVGDRVTAMPLPTPCGKCVDCLASHPTRCKHRLYGAGNIVSVPGAYAEYFKTHPMHIRKMPDGMKFEEAAMTEPCSTGYSVVRGMGIKPGDKVLISGGGIIGSMTAQFCKAFGADYVAMTEVNKFRGEKNLKDGSIDELFDGMDPDIVEKLQAVSDGGFKYFIECTGNAAAMNVGIQACCLDAMVAIVGVSVKPVPIPTMLGIMKRLTFKCFFVYTPDEFTDCMHMIANHRVDALSQYTRDCKPEEVQDMYKHLQDPKCEDIKIMIKFDN